MARATIPPLCSSFVALGNLCDLILSGVLQCSFSDALACPASAFLATTLASAVQNCSADTLAFLHIAFTRSTLTIFDVEIALMSVLCVSCWMVTRPGASFTTT
jgi:hypothetical protein